MSAEFQMQVYIAGDVGSQGFTNFYSTIPDWWSYPTFGAQGANDNLGYFYNSGPPSQAAINDSQHIWR